MEWNYKPLGDRVVVEILKHTTYLERVNYCL